MCGALRARKLRWRLVLRGDKAWRAQILEGVVVCVVSTRMIGSCHAAMSVATVAQNAVGGVMATRLRRCETCEEVVGGVKVAEGHMGGRCCLCCSVCRCTLRKGDCVCRGLEAMWYSRWRGCWSLTGAGYQSVDGTRMGGGLHSAATGAVISAREECRQLQRRQQWWIVGVVGWTSAQQATVAITEGSEWWIWR